MTFNSEWLQPGAVVPVDVPTLAAFAEELRRVLAQSEPVAWRYDQAKYRTNDLRGRQWAFNVFSQTKPYMDEMVRNVTPLYTAPPAAQRQWVGLTDEEIDKTPCELYAPDQGGMTMEEGLRVYARAIEAKLKEKNT